MSDSRESRDSRESSEHRSPTQFGFFDKISVVSAVLQAPMVSRRRRQLLSFLRHWVRSDSPLIRGVFPPAGYGFTNCFFSGSEDRFIAYTFEDNPIYENCPGSDGAEER